MVTTIAPSTLLLCPTRICVRSVLLLSAALASDGTHQMFIHMIALASTTLVPVCTWRWATVARSNVVFDACYDRRIKVYRFLAKMVSE